jgi:myo-inositol-1-phosphate synthase
MRVWLTEAWASLHPVLSALSYLVKAPLAARGASVCNALAAQRATLTDLLRAALALPPAHHLRLHHKVQ